MARCGFQVVGGALVFAALATSAAAQNAPAPIDTLNGLEAALLACWVPPPLDQSRPGTEITVLLSFKRSGELFGQPRITFVSPETSETERSAYRTAVTETLKRCASLPFSESFGKGMAGAPMTMRFVDDREQPRN